MSGLPVSASVLITLSIWLVPYIGGMFLGMTR